MKFSVSKEVFDKMDNVFFGIVVANGINNEVRTRRWIWRQSEQGKITKESKNIFFPIDGFKDKNYNNVISARDDLAELSKKNFNCKVKVGFVDINNSEFEF